MPVKIILSAVALIVLLTQPNDRVLAEESRCQSTTHQGVGALGRIEPRSRVIKVSHNAGLQSTRVEQLLVNESDHVNAGDTLAILSDHSKKKAEVEAAIARVKVLEAQRAAEQILHAYNKKEHLRHQSLQPDAAVSASQAEAKKMAYEQSGANLNRLAAEIQQAQAEIKVAQAELDNTLLRAPIHGTILSIHSRASERIGDNGLLEIADLTQLEVVAEVYETDLHRVKVGQVGCISGAGFKHTYLAEVRELGHLVRKNDINDTDPLSDRDNRIIEVRLTLEGSAVDDLQHQIFRQVKVRILP